MVDFFFWFWAKDQSLVFPLIEGIRRWHPESGIIAISDGPVHPSIPVLLKEAGVHLALSPERLKVPGRCEEYLLNGFTQLLAMSKADQFVQVDPDSVVRRRIYRPNADWAGQVFWAGGTFQVLYTVGAGAIFSRLLLERLVAHLEALPADCRTDFRYKDGQHISDDAAMGFHLGNLGFKPVPWVGESGWLEVELLTSYQPYLENDKWAITHPAKPTEDAMIDPLMALSGGVQMQAMQLITQAFRSGRTFRHG